MSQRATTREKRKAQFPATLPQRFMPRFLDQMDCRQTITKRLRQRVRDLVAESKATTPAQLILVQRVTFLEALLETLEVKLAEGKEIDGNQYQRLASQQLKLLRQLGVVTKPDGEPDEEEDDWE